MADGVVITDMVAALEKRQYPTVTVWNRLEPRPRTEEFDRALAAEIRDPLWMLCRQWQLGEFQADDAGSPVTAKIQIASARLNKLQPAEHAADALSDDRPIETQVERRPIPFWIGDQMVSLDLRLLMGRQWLRMLSSAVGDFTSEYRQAYPIVPLDVGQTSSAPVAAHMDAFQQWSAVAGRLMDGFGIYRYLKLDASHHAYDGISVPTHRQGDVDNVATRFVAWFEDLFDQPAQSEHAWRPEYLEYQFRCAAPEGAAEQVYTADEYYQGHIDWYSVDRDPARTTLAAPNVPTAAASPPVVTSFVPGQVLFDGMPNPRWWTFEDRKVNLGDVKPNTTDLGALLFLEFGLVYANDWFVMPQSLPVGRVAEIQGLAVTNVFGERTWIEATGSGATDEWQRWSMFAVTRKDHPTDPASSGLVLLPIAAKIQDGDVLEDIQLIRDEMANMVWGVETRIPLPAGGAKPGAEAARETLAFHERLLKQALAAGSLVSPNIEYKAPIRYQVMNSVPENWIPFIAVNVPGNTRKIQLQRAAMPRIIEGDPRSAVKVSPRTVLLREGLNQHPANPYYVHEEEVPRAGARVFQSFRRTRWYGGKVVNWLGVRKQTGRGEGSSGLAFDSLVPVKTKASESEG